jgi:hypothetical protein
VPLPKNFSPVIAGNEPFHLAPGTNNVYVYRFADQAVANDWLSRKRQASNGGFARPANSVLNDWAIKQSSYGSKAEGIADNPFLSVATDYNTLFANAEIWVQKILKTAPTLGVFVVPYTTLFRPSPTKLISIQETEWLFYDGDNPLTSYLGQWLANPL